MAYEEVLAPINIGSLTLPNRVVRSSHHTGLPWSDSPDELIAYHEARARGGVALTVLQTGGVHLSSPTGIPVYDDQVLAGYEKMVSAIAPHGMRLFQQLQHQGSARATHALGGPPWSASEVPNPLVGVVPIAMTQGQIDDVVESFAAAAARARDGGLDGVEVHAAHGYLIGQFLSPLTNVREDKYGGSSENRSRFLTEVLTAIRAVVGPSFPVGIRVVSDERVPGGLGPAEWQRIVSRAEPLVDYINVSLSTYYRYNDIALTMEAPLGYELPTSEIVTRSTTLPSIVTGRIMTLEHANQIVAEGQADMVSMVRALIADPDLVVKARRGSTREIRPCIGSNQGCMVGAMIRGRLGCVVNPDAAAETRVTAQPLRAEGPRRIVVVGGGPSGLEVARVSAERGHEVILYEATKSLGGQALIAASAPGRSDIRAITEWLSDEVRRLGVKIRLRSFADPDAIASDEPDVVVVATGASPRLDGFQTARPGYCLEGIGERHVYTVWDLFGFGGRASIGREALVYDDTGGFEAMSAAQELLDQGARVTFVTRFATCGAMVPFPAMTTESARRSLASGDFTMIPDSYLTRIGDDCVQIASLLSGKTVTVNADTVVMVGVNRPSRDLYYALDGLNAELHLVGDAASEAPAGHGLQHAIEAGSLLARSM